MGRPLVLAAWLVLGLARSAAAGPKTSKVTIETDPPGAKVYFNVKEDGEVCTTPCTVDAPIGETPIIVEAENRRSLIENLVVPRKTTKPMRVQYKLKPALGTLVIDGGDGATITIDDQSQGTAPRRFDDILAGAHHVVLEKNGKKLYDAFVEIEIGREATVSAPRVAAAEPAPSPPIEGPAVVETAAPPAPSGGPTFAVTATTDVGFRQFSFNYPTNGAATQQNDREVGQVLTGAMIELWPTTLLRLGVLPGLALYGRFALGVNPQAVTRRDSKTGMVNDTTLTTAWRTFEISGRHRWMVASAGAIEVSAGYLSDRFQFHTDDPVNGPGERSVVPDAAYKAVRIGARVSLLVGRLEPYLAAENRVILSGGVLEHRYDLGGSANGYHFALGAAFHLGHFDIRADTSLSVYSWTFRARTTAADTADSGSDLIEKIGVAVGYVY
jgi:hypothetical protein